MFLILMSFLKCLFIQLILQSFWKSFFHFIEDFANSVLEKSDIWKASVFCKILEWVRNKSNNYYSSFPYMILQACCQFLQDQRSWSVVILMASFSNSWCWADCRFSPEERVVDIMNVSQTLLDMETVSFNRTVSSDVSHIVQRKMRTI